jgi:hypothetical protein
LENRKLGRKIIRCESDPILDAYLHAAARTIPLAVIALVAIYQRSESAILLLGTLAGFAQLLDARVGLLQHDLGKSIGPLVIAAVCLLRGSVRGSVE